MKNKNIWKNRTKIFGLHFFDFSFFNFFRVSETSLNNFSDDFLLECEMNLEESLKLWQRFENPWKLTISMIFKDGFEL